MVKYYGRARQRIGSVNTNQIGLNMSGCPSTVGRQGYLNRYIGRRTQCNLKFCGPVYYHGVMWKRNSGRCVAKAPPGQSFNSGVGTKVGNPRFKCGNNCYTNNSSFPWWYNNPAVLAAVNLLNSHFSSLGLKFVLVGETETLDTDVVPSLPSGELKHYEKGGTPSAVTNYNGLPSNSLKKAVDLINSINFYFTIILNNGSSPMRHIVGAVTPTVATALETSPTPYGVPISFSSDVKVISYASTTYLMPYLCGLAVDGTPDGTCSDVLNFQDKGNIIFPNGPLFIPSGPEASPSVGTEILEINWDQGAWWWNRLGVSDDENTRPKFWCEIVAWAPVYDATAASNPATSSNYATITPVPGGGSATFDYGPIVKSLVSCRCGDPPIDTPYFIPGDAPVTGTYTNWQAVLRRHVASGDVLPSSPAPTFEGDIQYIYYLP